MYKFWQDVKRSLKLWIAVLIPATIIACTIGHIYGDDIGHKACAVLGILGGIYIFYYERKHKWWKQENPTSKDNSSSG